MNVAAESLYLWFVYLESTRYIQIIYIYICNNIYIYVLYIYMHALLLRLSYVV